MPQKIKFRFDFGGKNVFRNTAVPNFFVEISAEIKL